MGKSEACALASYPEPDTSWSLSLQSFARFIKPMNGIPALDLSQHNRGRGVAKETLQGPAERPDSLQRN